MAKSNDADAIMTRIVTAVKAANVPDYVISGMAGRMPKGQWPVSMAGEKPSRELLVIAGLFTKNTAGAEGGFHAQQMRAEGASLRELAAAFNCGPAHNHSVALSQGTAARAGSGYFWREQVGVGRWRLTFTPKGEKYVMAKLAAVTAQATSVSEKPAKAVSKPKGTSKPKRKGKVAPTETPTSEAPEAVVTVDPEINQMPVIEAPAEIGGVDAEHDQVTPADIAGLAEHFNS
jgi:hypothetical protein